MMLAARAGRWRGLGSNSLIGGLTAGHGNACGVWVAAIHVRDCHQEFQARNRTGCDARVRPHMVERDRSTPDGGLRSVREFSMITLARFSSKTFAARIADFHKT
jgi:hypothetical protein